MTPMGGRVVAPTGTTGVPANPWPAALSRRRRGLPRDSRTRSRPPRSAGRRAVVDARAPCRSNTISRPRSNSVDLRGQPAGRRVRGRSYHDPGRRGENAPCTDHEPPRPAPEPPLGRTRATPPPDPGHPWAEPEPPVYRTGTTHRAIGKSAALADRWPNLNHPSRARRPARFGPGSTRAPNPNHPRPGRWHDCEVFRPVPWPEPEPPLLSPGSRYVVRRRVCRTRCSTGGPRGPARTAHQPRRASV